MKATRSLLLSCLLALAVVTAAQSTQNKPLGGDILGGNDSTTTPATTSTTTSTPTPTPTPTTTSTTTSNTSTTTSSSSTSTSTSTTPTITNASTTPTSTTTTPPTQNTSTPPPQQSTITRTDSNGQTVVTVVTTDGATPTNDSDSSTSSTQSNNTNKDSSGLGTGSIIGLSVAGGVALIGIIAFFVWKFTRKRFTDFDDNEAIKWPELNAHGNIGGDSHPLPVHNTGRAGFDTGSEVSLSRAPSNSATNYSSPDLGPDPYAVPPLPHLNPNQPGPYRDDPSAVGGYYDPYRGPVPNTFSETGHEWGHGGEAIPMTQMAPPPGMGAMAMGGRSSPAPTIPRQMSPGPNAAYDMGRRSPGPNMMMGRASPAPHAAYDAYGPR